MAAPSVHPSTRGRLGRALSVLLAAGLVVAAGCAPAPRPGGPSAPGPPSGPLVLVSFDGFRADYLDRFSPPRLIDYFAGGVRAEALIPIFPSKTFPNHWTIVTGLYAEDHGIVANRMVDERTGDRFAMGDPSEFESRWWGGEPIWVTAERQGRVAATMFWPGSTVPIGGVLPTYYREYEHKLPNDRRIAQVMEWLDLPPARRPSLVTLYFADVDDAGHYQGPDSPETEQAVRAVDEAFGLLIDGLAARGLLAGATVVVVSDHGVTAVSPDRVIYLDDYLDLDAVEVHDWSPVLALRARDGNHAAVVRALSGRHPALTVYLREQVPERFHYRDHPHIAPVVGLAAEGWQIGQRGRAQAWMKGQHGYDNQRRSMWGIFLARGPGVAESRRVPAFEAVHVYQLLCALAGLRPAENDGSLSAVAGVLRESSGRGAAGR